MMPVPHKPNYVKHVLSGDLTFFHAADYFSYLTNEKCCYKVHFYSLFLSGIDAATAVAAAAIAINAPTAVAATTAFTLITYCTEYT